MKYPSTDYFPDTYQKSRQRFRSWLSLVQESWPNASLNSYQVGDDEDLTIDWIRTDSLDKPEKMVLINGGLHGVEGFVGSAMQALFIEEYLRRIDPQTTGILLIHAINPWGMNNIRRVNQENVDLNRNFLVDQVHFQEEFNQDYSNVNSFLNPSRTLSSLSLETALQIIKISWNLIKYGAACLRGAVMLGQRTFPQGLYFCGNGYQNETLLIMDLIKDLFEKYQSIIQIDLHTGYGPRYQMSLVNSPNEKRTIKELGDMFQYPRVLKADPDQFYQMHGDMINWVYQLNHTKFPGREYFGTAFEFGTYGSGILIEITSLRAMILENQSFQYNCKSRRTDMKVRDRFIELYNPSEARWKEKALADCRQAYQGIFQTFGFI